MKLRVRVYAEGQYVNVGTDVEIPEMYRECFEPLKTCDEPIMAYATGEVYNEAVAQKVMKTREDAAEVIAERIAETLVNEMKKHDTHNGYAKD